MLSFDRARTIARTPPLVVVDSGNGRRVAPLLSPDSLGRGLVGRRNSVPELGLDPRGLGVEVEKLRAQTPHLPISAEEIADEAALVKPLHDRVHVLVVQLRVLRNTLEAMENAAEKALEDVRRISASVEESAPDDDAL